MRKHFADNEKTRKRFNNRCCREHEKNTPENSDVFFVFRQRLTFPGGRQVNSFHSQR